MAVTDVRKDPGPHPTTPLTINPPAFDPNDTRSAEERWVDQQWRDAKKAGLGERHPQSINTDTSYA